MMNAKVQKDRDFMAQAVELAWAVKGKTFPNPAVGAVVVSRGRIAGEGATRAAGGPHAERVALKKAGERAAGATLYVTLEPCCHFGHTPPCTEAIITAKIRRVVAASADPNPLVSGKGFAKLRAAGITVEIGLLRDEAAAVNEDFFHAIIKKRAWITLKLACTLDGRIADGQGVSRWITGKEAREFGHELRRTHAAVAVGRATLERDDPRLTVRHMKGYSPARIVFTADPKIPRKSFFYRHANEARSIVVVSGRGARRIVRDSRSGLEFWFTGEKNPHAHLLAFASMAFKNDITSVLVEGGRKLASSFLESGLVKRVYLFYGNKILGRGKEGILFTKGLPLSRCLRLKKREVLLFGDTFGITGIPEKLK
ncbi:MAG: bifunctional diaminohydroxyphosphoribosylaminopyrimidine deaminase/5-amino-6-(5-phosphoribosylamino)uracil reductase RibD [Chitinispirillaceae bacterium]|nr:bifunctional diaminohydroxyphosphoribosylaminopyrimidine deaminase/5-amino-6-(5-phosphoribosylamino)uracil reductase RibD [Chitinispirillaceae bacterium]